MGNEQQKVSAEAAVEGVPERIWLMNDPPLSKYWFNRHIDKRSVEYARVSPVTVNTLKLAKFVGQYLVLGGICDVAAADLADAINKEFGLSPVDEAAELKQAVRDYFNIDPAENAAEWCAASNNLLRLVGLPVDHAPTPRAPDVGAEAYKRALVLAVIPYEALLADAESRKWIAPSVWQDIENAVAAIRAALTPPTPVVGVDAESLLETILDSCPAAERLRMGAKSNGTSDLRAIIQATLNALAASPVPSRLDVVAAAKEIHHGYRKRFQIPVNEIAAIITKHTNKDDQEGEVK